MREEFIHFPPKEEDGHFVVEFAGISYCDESYVIRRKRSACMVAEYIIKGQGTVVLNGREYRAKTGDIYLLPAGCAHLYYSDKADPWEKIWFNVRGTLPELLLQEYNPRNIVVFQQAGGQAFFQRFHEIGRNTEYAAEQKHDKAALVFHELLQYLYAGFYGTVQRLPEEMQRMKAYLDNHVTQNISLKELSEMVYLSESQIVRLFKRDLGKTPHEYSLDLKLEQAKKLLKNTSLRVREIAEYLNFCDEHYFSYIFKKKTGRTPLEYRKKI